MKRQRVVLSPADVHALLGACRGGATGARNRALIVLLYRTGLRLAEALALEWSDVRTDWITVRSGKGGKARTVPIDAPTRISLEEVRSGPKAPRVFASLRGKPLSQGYVRGLFQRLGRRIGLQHCHPHALRHTFAFELANEGKPLHTIMRLLGHSSLATTTIYVDHLGAPDLAEAVSSRPWIH